VVALILLSFRSVVRILSHAMQIECDLTISFAAAANSLAYLGGGWARSEPEFTWGIGAESHLIFPQPKTDDELILAHWHDPRAEAGLVEHTLVLAPDDNAHDLCFDGWLRVCANAYVLHQLQHSLATARRPPVAPQSDPSC
jgi:hypothetical protein